jgi:hypothetical protein
MFSNDIFVSSYIVFIAWYSFLTGTSIAMTLVDHPKFYPSSHPVVPEATITVALYQSDWNVKGAG